MDDHSQAMADVIAVGTRKKCVSLRLHLDPALGDEASTKFAPEREGITTVLWAGGFRPAFQWIEIPILDELGFPRATRGMTDIPGLGFVGLPWLHTRKSPLLLGVGDDAGHVADAVAEHLEAS